MKIPNATIISGSKLGQLMTARQKAWSQDCVVIGWGRFTVVLIKEKPKPPAA